MTFVLTFFEPVHFVKGGCPSCGSWLWVCWPARGGWRRAHPHAPEQDVVSSGCWLPGVERGHGVVQGRNTVVQSCPFLTPARRFWNQSQRIGRVEPTISAPSRQGDRRLVEASLPTAEWGLPCGAHRRRSPFRRFQFPPTCMNRVRMHRRWGTVPYPRRSAWAAHGSTRTCDVGRHYRYVFTCKSNDDIRFMMGGKGHALLV